jgi:hypothetical protein
MSGTFRTPSSVVLLQHEVRLLDIIADIILMGLNVVDLVVRIRRW